MYQLGLVVPFHDELARSTTYYAKRMAIVFLPNSSHSITRADLKPYIQLAHKFSGRMGFMWMGKPVGSTTGPNWTQRDYNHLRLLWHQLSEDDLPALGVVDDWVDLDTPEEDLPNPADRTKDQDIIHRYTIKGPFDDGKWSRFLNDVLTGKAQRIFRTQVPWKDGPGPLETFTYSTVFDRLGKDNKEVFLVSHNSVGPEKWDALVDHLAEWAGPLNDAGIRVGRYDFVENYTDPKGPISCTKFNSSEPANAEFALLIPKDPHCKTLCERTCIHPGNIDYKKKAVYKWLKSNSPTVKRNWKVIESHLRTEKTEKAEERKMKKEKNAKRLVEYANLMESGEKKEIFAPVAGGNGLYRYTYKKGPEDTDTIPRFGVMIQVHYEGIITKSGVMFDSSRVRSKERGEAPPKYHIDTGRVPKCLKEGVVGSRVGDRMILQCGYEYGYNLKETMGIPSQSDLLYDLEIFDWWKEAPQRDEL